jgi:hypothetical protein
MQIYPYFKGKFSVIAASKFIADGKVFVKMERH